MPLQTVFLSLILVFVAIILIVVGVFLTALSGEERDGGRRVEAGGLLIIGPLPIVFGSSEKAAKILLLLGIALTVLTAVLYILTTWVTP